MPDYLALVEVDQRQNFIISADKLREMLGASQLIKETPDIAERNCALGVKLIWPVSGVLWFTSKELIPLRDTLRSIRNEFRERGLSATFVLGEYSDSSFDSDLKALQLAMRHRKDRKSGEDGAPRSPFFAQCSIQGRLNANQWRPKDRQARRQLVSDDSATRLKEGKKYRDEILQTFDPERKYKKELEDFDGLIFSKSDSYISLCKADIDGLGRLLLKMKWTELGKKLGCSPENAAEQFANKLKLVIRQALIRTIAELVRKDSDKETCLPVLPLVYAGDDLWILCRRDLALDLALDLYRYFVEEALNDGIINTALELCQAEPLSLSIGILFAKKGFPFDAQLELAEELERSAKKYRRDSELNEGCVDYHWLESSGRETVRDAREAGYSVQDGAYTFKLTTRPWTVNDTGQVRAAAYYLLKIPRRKRHQLDTLLRYGYQLSDLAYDRWLRGLAGNEREAFEDSVAALPDRLRPTCGPWFVDESDQSCYKSCLAELAQLAEIVARPVEEPAMEDVA